MQRRALRFRSNRFRAEALGLTATNNRFRVATRRRHPGESGAILRGGGRILRGLGAVALATVGLVANVGCGDGQTSTPASSGSGGHSGGAGGHAGGAGGQAAGGSGGSAGGTVTPRVLLFTKATGFVHSAIDPAAQALGEVGQQRDWEVTITDDADMFNSAMLANYNVVAWVLTSGDVLNAKQQTAFEQFIQAGGGYVGIHSASDTEYDWPFYGELVGAYFAGHPAIQNATLRVEQRGHAATAHLPSNWERNDEWYSFMLNPRANAIVLLSIDEQSYGVGNFAMGDHPISWYHSHQGGRAFYTGLGHTVESWSEDNLVRHVAGGIEWAAGNSWGNSVFTEFDDGVSANGQWDRHQATSDFPYQVTPQALNMQDTSGLNQHLVRRGAAIDPKRAYAVEASFVIPTVSGGLNSFCLNLNLAGVDDDLSLVNTWAINVDLAPPGPGGVMKHMGFVDGAFNSIGETTIGWGSAGEEYVLRAFVNADTAGSYSAGLVSATVFYKGVIQQQFSVDYSAFPYQPNLDEPVRVGVNTHGADWSLRNYRVYYLDER